MEAAIHPNREKIHFSELTEKKLLRHYDLPAPIDPQRVRATLENGVLRIIGQKAVVTASPAVVELRAKGFVAA
jgi:HSP20 family molecular chaperone IbpA